MRTSHKCIPCFFRQIDITTFLIELNDKRRKRLFVFLAKKLLKFNFDQPPVVFGRTIYKNISRISKIKDIFGSEKIRIEEHLLRFTPYIEDILRRSSHPLYTAAKMCCAANAIDFGAGKVPNVKKALSKIKSAKLRVDHFHIFIDRLRKTKNLLVIGDNCGEILFDRFFIEKILEHNPRIKVFFAVRSSPIINDVLIADAKRVGIDALAKVISSGCDYPGIIISKTSASFRKKYKEADLIISKGQGNFESLWDKRKHIFYLFKIKCPTVSDFLSLPLNSLLFMYNKSAFR